MALATALLSQPAARTMQLFGAWALCCKSPTTAKVRALQHASIPGGRRTCSLVPPALPRDSIRAPPAEMRLVELQPRGPRERKPGPSSGLPHSQCPLPCSRELCTTVSESGCAGSETKIGRACVGKGAGNLLATRVRGLVACNPIPILQCYFHSKDSVPFSLRLAAPLPPRPDHNT